MRIIISLIALLSVLTSCISGPKTKNEDKFSNEYLFFEDTDSITVYAIIKRTIPIADKPLNVEKVTAELNGKHEGKVIQSASIMNNIFSGNYPISQKEKICISVFKSRFSSKKINEISVDFYAQTNMGKFRKNQPKTELNIGQIVDKNQFIKLIPLIDEIDESTLKFRALAIRQYPNQGDFLPTSENFRVIITNQKEGKRWSSSDGMMFMQMIGNVEPNAIGTDKILTLEYKIDQKKFKLNGMNTIDFMIPAKSNPAKATINYWKK